MMNFLRHFTRFSSLMFVFCLPTLAQPADNAASNALVEALSQTQYLQGHFQQTLYDDNNVSLAQSSGQFQLLRPGYFSWTIESPDSQLIIATPQYIWHHDLDLETVTRRPVTDSGVLTPLQILGGDDELLSSRFTVSRDANGVFTLIPRTESAGFKRVSMTLQGNLIAGMEIIDSLSQRIVINFDQLDDSSPLTQANFDFAPPVGVDLFYYDD